MPKGVRPRRLFFARLLKTCFSHGQRMKLADLKILVNAQTIVVGAASACMLALLLTHIACQSSTSAPHEAASGNPLQLDTFEPAASQPASPSSVMVYIKMVVEKKYGVLAHLIGGKRDSTVRHTLYDVNHSWWDNPLIAYAEVPFAHPDVIGQGDAQAISGE